MVSRGLLSYESRFSLLQRRCAIRGWMLQERTENIRNRKMPFCPRIIEKTVIKQWIRFSELHFLLTELGPILFGKSTRQGGKTLSSSRLEKNAWITHSTNIWWYVVTCQVRPNKCCPLLIQLDIQRTVRKKYHVSLSDVLKFFAGAAKNFRKKH